MPAHRSRKHHRTTTTKTHTVFDGIDLQALNPLGKSVNSTDALVGAFAGLALGAGVKYALNRINVASKREDGSGGIPDVIMAYAGPISTFIGGALAYFGRRGSNRAQAESLLVGGAVAAFAPVAWALLGKHGPRMSDGTPFFSDYFISPYGLISADQPYGHLTQDASPTFGDPYGTAEGAESFAP
jgi:hypothetical protein